MARFMVSMPDEMLKKLDRRAREEHRSRSELLREAVRRQLAQPLSSETPSPLENSRPAKQSAKKWLKQSLEQYLLEKEAVLRGCPGLDSLVGPVKGPVDMKAVLRIGKKLSGLSREIIEGREGLD